MVSRFTVSVQGLPQSFQDVFLVVSVNEILEALEHDEKLCIEVETVIEFRYLGDNLSTIGYFEAVVTACTRYGWVKLSARGQLLRKKGFH